MVVGLLPSWYDHYKSFEKNSIELLLKERMIYCKIFLNVNGALKKTNASPWKPWNQHQKPNQNERHPKFVYHSLPSSPRVACTPKMDALVCAIASNEAKAMSNPQWNYKKQFLNIFMYCNLKIMIIITSSCQMINMNVAGFELKIHLIQF
jgi:hypothetical protein